MRAVGPPRAGNRGQDMQVTGTSREGFERAFADAAGQVPPPGGDIEYRYELRRSWLVDGGLLGPMYNCEVVVTGPGLSSESP